MSIKHEQWLSERRNMIGASDVAAIIGVDPHRTALDVYGAKVFGEQTPDNDWLKFGRDVEGAIANMYAHKTGRSVLDHGLEIKKHPDITWLGATLDRVIVPAIAGQEQQLAPLELKHIGRFDLTPKQWETDPPAHYQIQLQIQMACIGASWGSLAGLFPGYQLSWMDIEKDRDLLDLLYPELDLFWNYNVKNQIPPQPESHRDLAVIKKIWGVENGETIDFPSDAATIVNDWLEAKALKKQYEDRAEELEAKIRAEMKESTAAKLPDGRVLTLKTTKNKGYTRVVEPYEYRTLRITTRKGE